MPHVISVYLSPEFRPVYELLDMIAWTKRIPMSTLVKNCLIEWSVEHGDLEPGDLIQKAKEEKVRLEIGIKGPCIYRMLTSATTIICKAHVIDGEQKALSACVDCEDHHPLG